MTRREIISVLAAAGPLFAKTAIAEFFGTAQGVGVVLDFATGKLVAIHRPEVAGQLLAPPGSTLKPLVLMSLLESGKIASDATHPCTGRLSFEGRSFACAHPRFGGPMDISTAIAYSCNEFVANAAMRFGSGDLARALGRFGLASRTRLIDSESNGRIEPVSAGIATQLQALGDSRVEVTALELAAAYRSLAQQARGPILEGLEGAVEFGTAQHAQIPGVKVGGKTGTAGLRWAWFAGFAPSRAPRAVVAVVTQGRAGGADAAPIGGRLLRACLEGQL